MNNSYTGYQYFNLTEQELAKFYADKNFLLNKLQENEYGILKLNGNITINKIIILIQSIFRQLIQNLEAKLNLVILSKNQQQICYMTKTQQ